MTIASNLKLGLHDLRSNLLNLGYEIETERWQGGTEHPAFLEILHASMKADMYNNAEEASTELKATQPWADIHFDERVGGIPCNPPPSHTMWLKDTDKYLMDTAFSHSYPERMWQDTEQMGIRFNIADLNTAVKLLQKEPKTRQCYTNLVSRRWYGRSRGRTRPVHVRVAFYVT
jgi:hypothetical protein